MAQIDMNLFDRLEKNRNTVHGKVYATYSSFVTGGKKYFQIDTYGKADRAMPGKISQSLQFDKSSAESLIALLKKEFNL